MERLRRFFGYGVIALLYIVAASFIFTLFITTPGVNTQPNKVSFKSMLAGDAHRPYAYRVLMPELINALDGLVPEPLWDRFIKYRAEVQIQLELDRANIERDLLRKWYIFKTLTVICFAGFAFSLFWLIRHFLKLNPAEAHTWAFVGLLFLPVFFGPINQLYDPPTLLLYPLAFISLYKQRLAAFYLVFILATLNKETGFILILLFTSLLWGRISNRRLVAHIALQLAIFLAITLTIRHLKADNPGGLFETMARGNARFLMLDIPVSLLITSVGLVLTYTIYGYAIIRHWKEKDPLLRRAFLTVFLPILLLLPLGGRIQEIRIFYEALVFIYLLSIPSFRELMGVTEQKLSLAEDSKGHV